MSNRIYPKYKEAVMGGGSNVNLLTGDIRVALIDTDDYTYDDAHEFLSDVIAAARVATSSAMTGKSVSNGTYNADNVTLTNVTGDLSEALILYVNTGTEGTSRLVAYLDTGIAALPVLPNGGDIDITWDLNGIFTL